MRESFNRSLPHPITISRWYKTIDGSPGWSQEAINTLKNKVAQAGKQHKLFCNLVLDEMAIRKRIEWDGKKFYGYVDIGTNFQSDSLAEAKQALVFMVVCINAPWKVPVGYFLLDGLHAKEKAALVNNCLTCVHKSGIEVTSLTFDGAPANISMATRLGADFSNVHTLKTYFSHTVTKA